MSRLLSAALMAATLLLSLCGCGDQDKETPSEHENAVYHWKSYLSLSDTETGFLNDHNITRVYIRFFDVRPDFRHGAVPESDVCLWLDELPKGTKIVPTVFITLEALKKMEGKEAELANNIYQRIVDMLKARDFEDFDELQIDCDWTDSTRDSFFTLCEALSDLAHENGQVLSATIRLHQLSQPAPPVDSGVLMVYNVGQLQDFNETNSILRADIVKQYLDKAPEYPLALDVAYPVFSWGVVFDGNRFDRLMRITTPIDSVPGLRHLRDNLYEVTNPRLNENILSEGYHETLRYESVSPETLLQVKHLVEQYLGGRPHRIILYHLDDATITNYTHDEISAVYE